MTYTVMQATLDDADEIFEVIKTQHIPNTAYKGFTIDKDLAMETIREYIEGTALIAKNEKNAIIAIASVYGIQTFFKEKEVEVTFFFVSPEWRGSGLSRDLLQVIVHSADAFGAAVIRASCLSGISPRNNALFVNLFKKFGFMELGTEMARVNG